MLQPDAQRSDLSEPEQKEDSFSDHMRDKNPELESEAGGNSKNVVQKMFGYVSSWWTGKSEGVEPSNTKNVIGEHTAQRTELLDRDISLTLRVEDLDYVMGNSHRSDSAELCEPTVSVKLGEQPTTVYLHYQTLLKRYPKLDGEISKFQSFWAVLTKLSSPTERQSILKKRMEKSNQRLRQRPDRQPAEGAGEVLEDADVDNPKVVVRVMLLDDGKLAKLLDGSGMVAEVDFQRSGVMLRDHVMVHELLRRQLGLEVTGKVQLTTVRWPAAELKMVTLHPLFEMVGGMSRGLVSSLVCEACVLHLAESSKWESFHSLMCSG